MKVGLVFRSKERNEPSIEAFFSTLRKYIQEGFSTEDFFLPRGRYNRISCLLQNYRYAKKIEADVYHITGEVNFVASAFPKQKTIITVHDYVDLETMKGIKRFIRWLFWCYIPYKHCRFIACVSNKTLRETISQFPFTKEKAVYIPNSIDDTYVKRPKEFNSQYPRILAIGTRENKNLERTIEALKNISCELYIIGVLSGEQKELLKKNEVNYTNVHHISNEEVLQAYYDCDMLCFPSTYEGFGRPITEANAVGRPVITSNIEPLIEVANGAAVLVDPYDVNSIRSGILRIIEDSSLREELVNKGFKNAEKYRAEKVANMYAHLYKTITDE